ncbi:MAG: PIN domain-containing protein [Oscillospiraceae bacterium]|nr:PIN domain-containing protein [Oscillospiraceae bacterium]
MNDRIFLDSNVLLYAFSTNEAEKRTTSLEIMHNKTCFTSLQALNEFCNVCVKKWSLERIKIEAALDYIIEQCEIGFILPMTLRTALALHERYKFSFFDCIMLASALESGCNIFYTEDLAHGQVVDGRLTIINPFV